MSSPGRAVIIEGRRTPFARSLGALEDASSLELGRMAVAGLLAETRVDPAAIEMLVAGRVVPDPHTSNVAREIVLGTDIPDSCYAHSVTMACVSSLQAALDVVRAIELGEVGCAIAAGCESLSDAPIQFQRPLRKRLMRASKAKGPADYFALLKGLKPGHLAPDAPAIAERTTGERMGDSCERMAKRMGISREAQDEYALMSHQRAAAAIEGGQLDRQVVPVRVPPKFTALQHDDGVRGDSTLEKLARLRPAFDKLAGTITAGNASFLTDGGAATLMASEARAEELGLSPLAVVRSRSVVGLDPLEELLLGPALAIPRALATAGLELDDIGVVELHEAFAAQVIAVQLALADPQFNRERLGRDEPVGAIDEAKLNAWGGSLSVGHPFGATGSRLITNCAHRMAAENSRYGLIAACAAGGLGFALVLEQP